MNDLFLIEGHMTHLEVMAFVIGVIIAAGFCSVSVALLDIRDKLLDLRRDIWAVNRLLRAKDDSDEPQRSDS